ncbi:MAG: dihydropteroate synthase [Chloroflexota bacterium]|nr:dihydropteroate synthase [Chloroflexota bacterium]
MSEAAGDRGTLRLGSRVLVWGTRTFVMGVLNVTPDSFSGDGVANDADALQARIDSLLEAAPDVIDVGGESTRPGGTAVPAEQEIDRIGPALVALRGRAPEMPLSVDTRKAAVARAALDLGAVMVNDVTGGTHDPEILEAAASAGAAFVVTHNRRGAVRRSEIGPHVAAVAYDDLVRDVYRDGERLLERAQVAGIARDRLLFDPGFGFGKSPEQNVDLLREMGALKALGAPLMVGVSRKSFVGYVLELPADQRLEGSLAAAVIAVANGADMVRAHDVEATKRALAMADAIYRPGASPAGGRRDAGFPTLETSA